MNHPNDLLTKEVHQWALEVFGSHIVLATILAGLDWLGWDWSSLGLGMLVYTLACAWLLALQWVRKRESDGVSALLSGGPTLVFVFPNLCKAIFELWGSGALVGDGPLFLNDWIRYTAENIGGRLVAGRI